MAQEEDRLEAALASLRSRFVNVTNDSSIPNHGELTVQNDPRGALSLRTRPDGSVRQNPPVAEQVDQPLWRRWLAKFDRLR